MTSIHQKSFLLKNRFFLRLQESVKSRAHPAGPGTSGLVKAATWGARVAQLVKHLNSTWVMIPGSWIEPCIIGLPALRGSCFSLPLVCCLTFSVAISQRKQASSHLGSRMTHAWKTLTLNLVLLSLGQGWPSSLQSVYRHKETNRIRIQIIIGL